MRLPYLDFHLDLGFAAVRTELMCTAMHCDQYVYVALLWRFLKWEGRFRLYEPGMVRARRIAEARETTPPPVVNPDPTWFPRRLHVRIDATVTAYDDAHLSREIADAIVHAYRQGRYRDGGEEFNETVTMPNGVRLRFRFWNRYGPTRWQQLRNRFARWWNGWGAH